MLSFLIGVKEDMKGINWRETGLLCFFVLAVYGVLWANPVTAYDFNSAKGDSLQVVLTYFFMHRIVQGMVAALFHDFSPFWNWAFGLAALCLFAHLILILAKRVGLNRLKSFALVALWLSAPFFYNRSVFQHAMPAEPIAFCFDALALLLFVDVRDGRSTRRMGRFLLAMLCVFFSASVYQAHVNLLLTAMLGVCALRPRDSGRDVCRDLTNIAVILGGGILLWGAFNFGPILAAKLVGVTFPKSGGAHDTIYWCDGSMPFVLRFKGFLAGFALNWVYDAFFVIGLRYVLLSVVGCMASVVILLFRRKVKAAVPIALFALSVFAMPCLQGSFENLRIYYCLCPLIGFAGAGLLMVCEKRRLTRVFCVCLIAFASFRMAHETATLYYYQWKTKHHDELHMGNVALDLWRIYGRNVPMPVAIVGGWSVNPTCWEDMRPNRDMPLLHRPFSTYSNMTDYNVPREFYVVAREKVGLVVDMPEDDTYTELKRRTWDIPAYPQPGYIAEREGVIIVNLGKRTNMWKKFDFAKFRSPNEKLLFKTLHEEKIDSLKAALASPFVELAKKYPWAVVDAQ